MADFYVTDEELTDVADAIRAKSGSQEELEFPDEFVQEIGNISVNVQADWAQNDSTADDYIKNKPTNLVQDANYQHTDNNYTDEDKEAVGTIEDKADADGTYPDFIAGNLSTEQSVVNTVPYLLRPTGGSADIDGTSKEYDTIIGGSVVENQHFGGNNTRNVGAENLTITVNNDNSVTVQGSKSSSDYVWCGRYGATTDHKIIAWTDANSFDIYANSGNQTKTGDAFIINTTGTSTLYVGVVITGGTEYNETAHICFTDLTQMFGTDIADYAYTLEQSTAGSGIAWLKSQGFLTEDYIPYNEGEIKSVSGLVSHDLVGFNQWDEQWENGNYNGNNGEKIPSDLQKVRNKNLIPVLPNTQYYARIPTPPTRLNVFWYDKNREFLFSETGTGIGGLFTTPENCYYMAFSTFGTSYNTYNNDICINLSDPNRNGEYEPYVKHSYPLDSSLTLRGIPKLVDGKIQYDGDVYRSDGSVARNYEQRVYQIGDESLADAITDGTTTVVKLATPTTSQAEPFSAIQICDPNGTEEYVTTGIPVGHETEYPTNLKYKLEKLPKIPQAPSASGTYTLKATVTASGVVYSWV